MDQQFTALLLSGLLQSGPELPGIREALPRQLAAQGVHFQVGKPHRAVFRADTDPLGEQIDSLADGVRRHGIRLMLPVLPETAQLNHGGKRFAGRVDRPGQGEHEASGLDRVPRYRIKIDLVITIQEDHEYQKTGKQVERGGQRLFSAPLLPQGKQEGCRLPDHKEEGDHQKQQRTGPFKKAEDRAHLPFPPSARTVRKKQPSLSLISTGSAVFGTAGL